MQKLHRHRGADPKDERSFGAGRLPDLRQAVHDVCWLLDRCERWSNLAREVIASEVLQTRVVDLGSAANG
jgi:hypothetical protein